MKLFRNIFSIFLSTTLITSCDFMDCSESDYYELNQIKESFSEVKGYATNVYSYLRHDFCSLDGAMLDAASDDAIHVYETSNIQYFVNGTWAPNKTIDDVFGHYYRGIHDANFYLANFLGLKFESWKDNASYEDDYEEYLNYEYEVRFLRAYYYFELVRRYQNIPLVQTVVDQSEVNSLLPSASSEIFDFIIKECGDIAEHLPVDYSHFTHKEFGRATKGAALALRAKAALYAASSLFNKDNDKAKWEKAAEYAYSLIGQAAELGYKLDGNFNNLFGAQNNNSKEVIFYIPTGSNNDFEKKNFPFGVIGGQTSTCPTENLVSAFEMRDGSKFDWSNAEMSADPYANRDPRFYMTIVHNGMPWPADKPVEIFDGGANARPLPNATKTGYYLRKYVNKSISFEPGAPTANANHNWVLFRYAEVLLNYAEAMVNAYDGVEYTNEKCGMSALEAVNLIRKRTGVDMPALPVMGNEEFLERVKNERRVEMAFEGQRFWDIRRWKELDVNEVVYGVHIEKNGSELRYEKFELPIRPMDDKMYFYPISDQEKYKNDNLIQNPGW